MKLTLKFLVVVFGGLLLSGLLGIMSFIYRNYDLVQLQASNWIDSKYEISPNIILHQASIGRTLLKDKSSNKYLFPGNVLALQYEGESQETILVLYQIETETYNPTIDIFNPANLPNNEFQYQVMRINVFTSEIVPVLGDMDVITQQLKTVSDFVADLTLKRKKEER